MILNFAAGAVGHASVIASTISGIDGLNENIINEVDSQSKRRISRIIENDKLEKAIGNVDFEIRSTNVSFPVSLMLEK